jgi:hypothetical protein
VVSGAGDERVCSYRKAALLTDNEIGTVANCYLVAFICGVCLAILGSEVTSRNVKRSRFRYQVVISFQNLRILFLYSRFLASETEMPISYFGFGLRVD